MEEMRRREREYEPDVFELLTLKATGQISSEEFNYRTKRMKFKY